LLCLTVQQRRVELLTITSPENMKDDLKKRVIFITARIHPGKTFLLYYMSCKVRLRENLKLYEDMKKSSNTVARVPQQFIALPNFYPEMFSTLIAHHTVKFWL